jgi:redox-sensitive bicupin YhaK (pirin superfamily)
MAATHSSVVRAATDRMGEAFEAHRLTSERFEGLMDPLLLVDHFRMTAETFAAHPHAGFSPLTLLFEDSAGSIRNRDSLGVDLVIEPGDLLWTLAGRGVIHVENPVSEGPVCHGLQIWVNLPARDKGREPLVRHLRAADIPAQVRPGVRVRVVVGEWAGMRSPLDAPQPLALLDGFLAAGAPFGYELPKGWNGLLYLVEGGITLEWEGSKIPLAGGEAIALGARERPQGLAMRAAPASHFVLVAGAPIGEPVVAQGPFVMNDSEGIRRALDDFRAGRMGTLERSAGR